MTFREILARFENVKKSGGGYTARCPAHKDDKNSLSIAERSAKAILHCHALCNVNDICSAANLKLSDLFFDSNSGSNHAGRKEVAAYDYQNENGSLLFQAVRFQPKDFRQRHFDQDGKTVWDLNGTRRVLYRLPELVEAEPTRAVFIVEGEKDVETLRAGGLVATCNPMGAGKWRDEFSDVLKDRTCYILPDNDEPGRKHAEGVARSLEGKAAEIRIACLPGLPEKGDVTDFLETHSVEELKEIIKAAPIYAPPIEAEPVEKFSSLAPLRTVKLSEVIAKKIEWIWDGFIPQGMFTLDDGEEGIGKSLSLLQGVGMSVATGKSIDPSQVSPRAPANVLILSAEESLPLVIKPRLDAIGAPCERFIAVDEPLTLDSDGFARLSMAIDKHEPRLVIIDPLFSYTGKVRLNDDNEIRSVTDPLTRLAEKFRCAIIGVRHINKSKGLGDARNAGLNGVGWRAAARSVLLTGRDPETGKTAIVQTKTNISPGSKKAYGYRIDSVDIRLETGEIVSAPKLVWTGESDLTAETMLSALRSETSEERTEKSDAVNFLRETLKVGQKSAQDIRSEAQKVGISDATLRRAKASLRVKSVKDSFNGKWFWSLEDAHGGCEDAQRNEDERLRPETSNNSNRFNNIAEGAHDERLRTKDEHLRSEGAHDEHLRVSNSKQSTYIHQNTEGAHLSCPERLRTKDEHLRGQPNCQNCGLEMEQLVGLDEFFCRIGCKN